MSLYGDYIAEREGKGIIEHDYGFATYYIAGDECYLSDVFVDPRSRRKGLSVTLAREVEAYARSLGCKYMTASVCPRLPGSTRSMALLLKDGYQLHSAMGDLVYLIREIREE